MPATAVWVLTTAALGLVLGAIVDIAWDASIGRHSWASPPHLLINLCAGLSLGVAVSQWRKAGVAALLAGLGGAALLLAEVHAEWFGLNLVTADVEPGWMASVAVAGMFAVAAAAVLAAAHPLRVAPLRLACVALLLLTATAASPYSLPNLQRTALFVQLSAALYPGLLLFARQVLARPFGATEVSAGYMAVVALLVWTLPLWPARPEVAPVYQSIEALLPPRFPLLLLVPALVVDAWCRWGWRGRMAGWASGGWFVLSFVPVQWYFAAFLLAPASDHWFFAGGGEHWPFYLEIGSERGLFWGAEESPLDLGAMVVAVVAGVLSAAAGDAIGRRLRDGMVTEAASN